MPNTTLISKCIQSRIVVLLGAGASAFLKIPLATELTKSLDHKIVSSLESIIKISGDEKNDIEKMLAIVDSTRNSTDEISKRILGIETVSKKLDFKSIADRLKRLQVKLTKHIYNVISTASQSANRSEAGNMHGYLIKAIRSTLKTEILPIITTNYDTVIEDMCDSSRLNYADGWDRCGRPQFWKWKEHNNLEFKDQILSLFKIHGSINWFDDRQKEEYVYIDYGISTPEITQSCWPVFVPPRLFKDREIRAHKLLLGVFRDCQQVLNGKEILLIIGYKMSDDTFNNTLFPEMLKSLKKIIIVDPNASAIQKKILSSHHVEGIKFITITEHYGLDTGLIDKIVKHL